jgi:hypothetical protein
MDILKRALSVLRGDRYTTREQKEGAPAKITEPASDTAKPYRIVVRGVDGFVSKPATAEEAIAYANDNITWRHLA